MATLKDFRNERLRKLDELKKLGVDPYPAKAERTNYLIEITQKFDDLTGHQVTVVGRIQNIRRFGQIAFLVIKDISGQLQLFLKADLMAGLEASNSQLGFNQLPLLDSGDFVEASGTVIKTQTGEISVEVRNLRLLTKSLRPLPTKQDGFTNKEERLRRRYVDMNVNEQVRERFIRRSKFWQATRDFLNQHNFIEINIPVLEHTTGGADANPFVTHMDALDQDFTYASVTSCRLSVCLEPVLRKFTTSVRVFGMKIIQMNTYRNILPWNSTGPIPIGIRA